MALAAGWAGLEEIECNDLTGRARTIGQTLKTELQGLAARFPFIGDVRGKGLLLAFELVSDKETMKPLPTEYDAYLDLVEEAYSRGLIIYSRRTRGGREGDHFMVCPPLIATQKHIEEIVEKLTASLDTFARKHNLPRGNL
mgnify:CR=1 FL=1